jgi:formylglycine-generating enzyme required for sulfatase activity
MKVNQVSPEGNSAFGVVGMAGNIWEMCQNLMGEPFNATLEGFAVREMRGGSFKSTKPAHFKCDSRQSFNPAHRMDYVGFRIVRERN